MGVSPPRVTAPPPAWLAETRLPVTSESIGPLLRAAGRPAGKPNRGRFADHLRGLTGT